MNILISPAAYFMSDTYGSEYTRSYNTIDNMSNFVDNITSIVGYSEIEKSLQKNVDIINIFENKKINQNSFFEMADKLRFIYEYYKIASKLIESGRFDIFHHLNPISPETFNLIPILKKLKIPFVIGAAMPPQQKVSFEEFVHHYRVRSDINARIVDISTRKLAKYLNIFFKKTVNKCDKFICATQESKDFFQKFVPEDKLVVIHPGIDTNLFYPLENKEKDYIEILLLSYFTPRKGIDYAIRAMKNICDVHTNVKMRIVGKGLQEEYLKKLTINLGITQNVIFTGFIPRNQLPLIYQNCDVFCSPTLYEPFGHTILEAMACRKPVIASSVGGIPEILTEKEGILVRPADVEDLTNAFMTLLADQNKIKELGKNGRKRIEKLFDWKIIGKKYYNVYEEVLNGKQCPY